ncbi:MAG: ABC transporter permease subunit [Myxococcales bacterium]|nr:ABC transporter permease subunit [Myxococcales bacterium]
MRPGASLAIAGRELSAYFFSPLGWIVLALFLLVQGYAFYLMVELLSQPMAPHGAPMQFFFGGTFIYWLFVIMVVSAITMRLLAEERQRGTLEVLLTAPVSETEVVIGKFAAGWLFYGALWLPTLCFVAVLGQVAGRDAVSAGPVAAGYIGTMLAGGACIAIGTLISALARSQIGAALGTFAVLTLLLLLGPLELFTAEPWLEALVKHVNLFDHMEDFGRGVIDSRHVVFHASVITFCLAAAVKALERRKHV